jgi:hypothetical protein
LTLASSRDRWDLCLSGIPAPRSGQWFVSYHGIPLWLVKLWGGGPEPEDKPYWGRPS